MGVVHVCSAYERGSSNMGGEVPKVILPGGWPGIGANVASSE